MTDLKLVSGANNTFYRFPPTTTYDENDVAVIVTNSSKFWPKIINADNGWQPDYIWYSPSTDPTKVITGEQVIFGREVRISLTNPLPANHQMTLLVSAAADNAFYGRITVETSKSAQSWNIPDGSTNPNTGLTEIGFPHNWQNIYENAQIFSIDPSVKEFTVQFEALVTNYAQTNGTPQTNPAGVIYLVRILNIDKFKSVTEVTPPDMTNPIEPEA